MNILLLGYGKMGQLIERLALEKGHEIAARIDESNSHTLSDLNTSAIDVAIEFSQPEAALKNITFCLNHNIPVLSGTTGWLDKMKEVESLCNQQQGTFFYASNYSIGVNVFFKLNEQLATLMKDLDSYRISLEEIHHTQKKDAPSGTAITLAEGILNKIESLKKWQLDYQDAETLPIRAIRKDDVPGTHIVTYESAVDSIEIKHVAHSREGFAKGALAVAEWLPDQKGVLSMADFLKN